MQSKLNKIFKKKKKIIIGAIHFPPLLGYKDFPGFRIAVKNVLADLKAFEEGGIDAVIFENNYDIPHKIFVDRPIISAMTDLGVKIKKTTNLPVGVNVLWNDYKVSLSIAKVLNLQFIRVPVFVDNVKASCGIIRGEAEKIIKYRKKIGADDVLIFTDIHVKHSKLLSKMTLVESAKLAIKKGSDALIITGSWTGHSPDLAELKAVRKAVGKFKILAGSGADKNNIKEILKYADGVIVSTSLKSGEIRKSEINVKNWKQRISKAKVKEFMREIE